MEREGRNNYDNQDSYYNRSCHRSRSPPPTTPRYNEDDYHYYYDKPEDNYCRPHPILCSAVRFEDKERPRNTW